MQTKSFDELLLLHQRDPDAFEAYRKGIIEDFISMVPEERQQKLRQLQWKIDGVRRKHHNPMGATIALHRMMLESINDLCDLWQQVLTLSGALEREAWLPHRTNGNVIYVDLSTK